MELRSQGWLINHKRFSCEVWGRPHGFQLYIIPMFCISYTNWGLNINLAFVGLDILLNFFVNVFSLSLLCGLWSGSMEIGDFIWQFYISPPPPAPLSYAYLDFNNTISLQTQEPEIKTSNGQWASVGHFLFKNKLPNLVRITYIVSLLIGVFLKNHNNIIHIIYTYIHI